MGTNRKFKEKETERKSNVNARTGDSPRKFLRNNLRNKFNRHFVVCYSLRLSYCSFFFLFVCNLLLDSRQDLCGSKNWGGPVHRRLDDGGTALKTAALTNTYLQKYTHEQLAFIRLRLLSSFVTSCRYALYLAFILPHPPSLALHFVFRLNRAMYMCVCDIFCIFFFPYVLSH